MKRHHDEIGTPPDPITKMAVDLARAVTERSRMNKELLITLANAVGANERVQRRFRYAVVHTLSRIEATVQGIHALQIVLAKGWEPRRDEKIRAQAETSEGFISRTSDKLGLGMVNYIYGEPVEQEEPTRRRGRRPKWSGWEI